MLKVDRTELDEAIKNMSNIFASTEAVLDGYEKEKAGLEKRQAELAEKLSKLQEMKAEFMLKREETKSTSTYVKLSKQMNEVDEETTLLMSLQEQLKEDFKALKQKYLPIIRDTYSKDLKVKEAFEVNENVEYVLHELVKGIADFAKTVREEDGKVMPLIRDEFLNDSQLMQENPSFRRRFDFDRTKLSYSSLNKAVLRKEHINLACSGSVTPEIRLPKGVK